MTARTSARIQRTQEVLDFWLSIPTNVEVLRALLEERVDDLLRFDLLLHGNLGGGRDLLALSLGLSLDRLQREAKKSKQTIKTTPLRIGSLALDRVRENIREGSEIENGKHGERVSNLLRRHFVRMDRVRFHSLRSDL